jgi:hypothetical protein
MALQGGEEFENIGDPIVDLSLGSCVSERHAEILFDRE